MRFVSYAQNFEDVMLWRALRDVSCGFYIDVGANDPVEGSVSKAFYDRGWRGINIEPVGQWFERLIQHRPRDINLQVAAGATCDSCSFYEIPDSGLSTMVEEVAAIHRAEYGSRISRMEVAVRTLTDICREYHTAPIHFMKIDIEGAELQALKGLDLAEIRPWIIVVEATIPNSQIDKSLEWAHLITAADYVQVYFDGLNHFYVSLEHQHLKEHFMAPPNVFDKFVLGEKHAYSLPTVEKLEEARAEAARHREACTSMNGQLDALRVQLESSTSALEQARVEHESNVSVLSRRIEELVSELRAEEDRSRRLNSKVQELYGHAHHWRVVADGLSKHLQAVYDSTSWRITAPLRHIREKIAKLVPGRHESPCEDQVLPAQQAADPGPAPIEQSHLTPRALGIYHDLNEAMGSRGGSNADRP